jgi:hypothetical protein
MTVPSIELLLIAGRAVFLLFSFALAAVAFTRWRRAAQAQTAQLQANHEVVLQRLADLEARIAATNLAVSQLGERMERPQQLTAAPAASSPGYQIAIRLAKSGASREELVSKCGLSSHEAELVHRLHAPQAKSRRARPEAA